MDQMQLEPSSPGVGSPSSVAQILWALVIELTQVPLDCTFSMSAHISPTALRQWLRKLASVQYKNMTIIA